MSKIGKIKIIIFVVAFSTCHAVDAAAWNAKGNYGNSQESARSFNTAAPRVSSDILFQSPSTRGRGGASHSRGATKPSYGEELLSRYNAEKFHRERKVAPIEETVKFYSPSPYTFTLDPNPTFKPYILQPFSTDRDIDKYEFKLFNPYSDGLFHQFGTE